MEMLNKKLFKLITFLSAKGGTGKSSFCINLAYTLVKQNYDVLIVDTNFLFPNIDIYLEESKEGENLKANWDKRKNVIEFIEGGKEGIKYLSIPTGNISERHSEGSTRNILKSLKGNLVNLDFVLVDTPSGINEDSLYLSTHSDKVIVITTGEIASLSNSYLLLKYLSKKTAVLPEILINKVVDREEAITIFNDLKNITKKLLKVEIKLFGYIPYDKNLEIAVKNGDLPFKNLYSPYTNSIKTITKNLTKGG